jgi:hypothetical protein
MQFGVAYNFPHNVNSNLGQGVLRTLSGPNSPRRPAASVGTEAVNGTNRFSHGSDEAVR